MKTILSCDHVFETLTRGPFPTGGPDDAGVEAHLAGCHECRCLAEALRPAATLFHESLSATEQESLPSYAGLLSRLTNEVFAEPQAQGDGDPRSVVASDFQQWMRFGTAMLLGLSLCLVLVIATSGVVTPNAKARSVAAASIVRTAYHPNEERLAALANERLPSVCFPADWQSAIADLNCCSQCHAAGAPARATCQQTWNRACVQCHRALPDHAHAPRLFAVLQKSCAACHDS